MSKTATYCSPGAFLSMKYSDQDLLIYYGVLQPWVIPQLRASISVLSKRLLMAAVMFSLTSRYKGAEQIESNNLTPHSGIYNFQNFSQLDFKGKY